MRLHNRKTCIVLFGNVMDIPTNTIAQQNARLSVCIRVHQELSLTSRSPLNSSVLERTPTDTRVRTTVRAFHRVRACEGVRAVGPPTSQRTTCKRHAEPYREDARARAQSDAHLYDPVMRQNINEAFKLSDMRAH